MGKESRARRRNIEGNRTRKVFVPDRLWTKWKTAADAMRLSRNNFIIACCNHAAHMILESRGGKKYMKENAKRRHDKADKAARDVVKRRENENWEKADE